MSWLDAKIRCDQSANNLRLHDSGIYLCTRNIYSIGNSRFLWTVYKITEEAVKRVPELYCKYLRRRLKQPK